MRDLTQDKEYQSRGNLVLDYVKLKDDDIEERLSEADFFIKLYEGVFKGFNLIFGNIFENEAIKDAGKLRHYQNKNVEKSINTRPTLLKTAKAHGCSNGDMNTWAKVIKGRYAFFKTFLQAEKDVK